MKQNSIPVLTSARIRLRPFVASDAIDVQKYAGDRDIAYNTTNIPHPYKKGMAISWIETHLQEYNEGRGIVFAIEHRDPVYFIGAIGLHAMLNEHHRAELGFWIGKPFWGNGFCTEAARTLIAFAFQTLKLNRIVAYHFSRNPASGRVLQKLNMRHEGTFRQHMKKWGIFVNVEAYGILRNEFIPSKIVK